MVDDSTGRDDVRAVVVDDFAENGAGTQVLDFEMIRDFIIGEGISEPLDQV